VWHRGCSVGQWVCAIVGHGWQVSSQVFRQVFGQVPPQVWGHVAWQVFGHVGRQVFAHVGALLLHVSFPGCSLVVGR
jgi:hypothetical protein